MQAPTEGGYKPLQPIIKSQHVMAPLIERVAVPLAYVAIGVLLGMYLNRKKVA